MAAKTRVNITVDPQTLRLADRLARARKTSRSAVLREGVHALAENQANQLAEKERRDRQRREGDGSAGPQVRGLASRKNLAHGERPLGGA
jgi:predicted transcriptional regulator